MLRAYASFGIRGRWCQPGLGSNCGASCFQYFFFRTFQTTASSVNSGAVVESDNRVKLEGPLLFIASSARPKIWSQTGDLTLALVAEERIPRRQASSTCKTVNRFALETLIGAVPACAGNIRRRHDADAQYKVSAAAMFGNKSRCNRQHL